MAHNEDSITGNNVSTLIIDQTTQTPEECDTNACACECSDLCDIEIHPTCPLRLVRNIFVDCESIFETLQIMGSLQQVAFKYLQYLVGGYLILVIPKFIVDKCKNVYCIDLDTDVRISDVNFTKLNVIVITHENAHYVKIPITDLMFSDCDLILYFTKLRMLLTEVISPCNVTVCNKAWKWLPSVVLNNDECEISCYDNPI